MPHKNPQAKTNYLRAYRAKNRAHISQLHRCWVAKNKDRMRQNQRRWYLANQERLIKAAHDQYHSTKVLKPRPPAKPKEYWTLWNREYARHRYWKNPEKYRAQSKQYRKLNPEKHKASRRRWLENNKERHIEMHRQWVKRNPHKNRFYKGLRRANACIDALAVENYYAAIRRSDIVSCVYCGKLMQGKFAHIDHIVPVSRGGPHCVDNLCPSCQSCNSQKHNKLLSEWRPELEGVLKGGLI